MMKLFEKYGFDTAHQIQGIFTSVFVIQNRLQTACEKIQTEISMKQWLLIAMTECCPEPRTLTNLGELMGCSRQNVKKLALVLEKQGFIRLVPGSNNSLCVELTEKVADYANRIGHRQTKALQLLFMDFSVDEIAQLFHLYTKLYVGIERVENYTEELD